MFEIFKMFDNYQSKGKPAIMLVEDLARVFAIVLEDYTQFKIDDLFNITQAALQARNNSPNYNIHAANVRQVATDLIQNSRYVRLPRRHRDLFESSKFAPASPERLGNMFLAALPGDPQRAISSGELNGDKDQYHNARGSVDSFLSACSQVNIVPMIQSANKAHFQLSFSELNFKRNMEETGELLKRWNKAFELISRYSIGRVESIEIEYVGTTDLTFWLSTGFDLLPVILIYYSQILDAVDRTIKTLNALSNLRDAGHVEAEMPTDTEVIENNAAKIVEAFVKNVSAGAEAPQQEELTGGINVSSKLLIEDVLKGTRLHVEYRREVVLTDKIKPTKYTEDQIKLLLAKNTEMELKISEYSGKERVLLPGKEGA
jgi:hypothetical protein